MDIDKLAKTGSLVVHCGREVLNCSELMDSFKNIVELKIYNVNLRRGRHIKLVFF